MNQINEQSVLYRPYIENNFKLDKKFFKRKKQIFESSNLKHTKNKNNQDQKSTLIEQKSKQKLQLPDIYLYAKPKHKQIIPIEQKVKIVKQISKNLNFINKKRSVINGDLLKLIKQLTKPVPYDSQIYKNQLTILNEIFHQCGIYLRTQDVLMLQGLQSKNKYSLFTNSPKHPQSLCCEFQVIIKHVDFVSPQRYKIYGESRVEKSLKSLLTINCLKCGHDIIKILPSHYQTKLNEQINRTNFDEQKRLINFSKLISSGRFKKTLINDQSIQLIDSRNVSLLTKSKTSLEKLKLKNNSHTLRLKHQKEQRYERQNRVKSQQMSLQLKQRFQQNNTMDVIKKRDKTNIRNPLLKFFKQKD